MRTLSVLFFSFLFLFTISCDDDDHPHGNSDERVVIANRASNSITVIDAKNNTVLNTYPMPNNGEPMYVVHIKPAHAVFVGDRANNLVVAFDDEDFSVKGTVAAGAGVFHMWASPSGNRLWVNNDIDNTTTIINPISMRVVGTAHTPADLVAAGGKPHDVFVDPTRKFAYVSVLGVAGSFDYVVKYNGRTFQEVGRAAVGKDPHLSATRVNNKLYVPCQGNDAVFVLNRNTMAVLDSIPLDNAHGAIMSNSGAYFYSADISGSRLATIDNQANSLLGTPLTTPFPTAHNLAVNSDDSKMFVTHSGGTNDKVTIYDLSPTPAFSTTLTVGLNPFGLAYYTTRRYSY